MPIFQILGTVGACLWPRSAKAHRMRSAIKCVWPILVIIGCVCDGVRVHSPERFGKEDLHPHRRPPAVCARPPLCVIILFSSDTLRMISLSEWIGTSYTSFICWLQFRGCENHINPSKVRYQNMASIFFGGLVISHILDFRNFNLLS